MNLNSSNCLLTFESDTKSELSDKKQSPENTIANHIKTFR